MAIPNDISDKISELNELAKSQGYRVGQTWSDKGLTLHRFLAPHDPAFDDFKDLSEEDVIYFPQSSSPDITMVLNGDRAVKARTENPPRSVIPEGGAAGDVSVVSLENAEDSEYVAKSGVTQTKDEYVLSSTTTTNGRLYFLKGPYVNGWGGISMGRAIIVRSKETDPTEPANFFGILLAKHKENYHVNDVTIDYSDHDLYAGFSYPIVTLSYLPSDIIIDPRTGKADIPLIERGLEVKTQIPFTLDGLAVNLLTTSNNTHFSLLLSQGGLARSIAAPKRLNESQIDTLDTMIRSADWYKLEIAPLMPELRVYGRMEP